MQMDDMILVSIDDHMIEPPDMYKNHLPAKWLDQAPKIVRNDAGHRRVDVPGRGDRDPVRHGRDRRLAARGVGLQPRLVLRAAAGLLGRARACARHGRQRRARRRCASRRWRGSTRARSPRRATRSCRSSCSRPTTTGPSTSGAPRTRVASSRSGIVPMWDVDLAVAEVHRIGQEGLPLDQLPRGAARAGLPELPVGPLGPDARRRSCDENMVLSLHIGAGFDLIQKAPEAPIDHLIVLPAQITMLVAQDLLFGPTLRQFPDLKVALSEGGIGWIPFYLDRADRHFQNQAWLAQRLRRQDAVRRVPRAHPRLLTSPTRRASSCATASASTSSPGSATTPTPTRRGRSRPSSPGRSSRTRVHRRRDPQDHLGEHLPLLRLGPVRAHAEGAGDRGCAAGAGATDVDTTRMSREEWRKRNEAAGIGTF